MANVITGTLVANDLIPTASHAAGSLTFGPLNVPAGFTILMISFDLRQVASLTPVFTTSVEISLDSGANWVSAGGNGLNLAQSGYVLNGGVLSRSASDALGPGAPVRVFAKQVSLMHAETATRQVRGVLTCSEAVIAGVTLAAW